MEIKMKHNDYGNVVLEVKRGEKDAAISKESTFYYQLAKEVNKLFGWDTIRKEMCKDGHMVSDGQFYLVDRKRQFGFFQTDWATYDVCKDYYNKRDVVVLSVHDMREDTTIPIYDYLTA